MIKRFLTVRNCLQYFDSSLNATDVLMLSALLEELNEYPNEMTEKYFNYEGDQVWRSINPDYMLGRYPILQIQHRQYYATLQKLADCKAIDVYKSQLQGYWVTSSSDLDEWVSASMAVFINYHLVPQHAIYTHPKLRHLKYKQVLLATYLAHIIRPKSRITMNAEQMAAGCKWLDVDERQVRRILDELISAGVITKSYGLAHKRKIGHTALLEFFKPNSKSVRESDDSLFIMGYM